MLLEIPSLTEFVREVKDRKIGSVRLFSYYKTEAAGAVSFTTFFIKLTAKAKDPLFVDNDLIYFDEPVGRGITQFEDEMKKISDKTVTRVDEIKKLLEKEKLKVLTGVWRMAI